MRETVAVVVEKQRLSKQSFADTRGAIQRYRDLAIGTSIFVLLAMGYAAYRAGSIGRAIPYLRGQRVFVEPMINLGAIRCGDEVNVKVTVVNCGFSSVNVVGARKSCGCIGIETFPVEVQAGSARPLELKISVPPKAMEFIHRIELYIAEVGQNFTPFSIALSGMATE